MRRIFVMLGLLALAGVGVLLVARKPPPGPVVPGERQVAYPRVGMISNMRTTGDPFVIDGVHGGTQIDSALCRYQARYDFVIIEPARDGPPQGALRLIRSYNPGATLIAFVSAGRFFVCGWGWYGQTPPPYGCSPNQLPWSVYLAVTGLNAVLFNQQGTPFVGWSSGPVNIDYARAGVAQALADTFTTWTKAAGVFDGVFTDELCASIGWMQKPTERIDLLGFPSFASWDSAFRDGTQELLLRLDSQLPMVLGNCGPYGPAFVNGWLGENFPNQPPAKDGMTFAQKWAAWDTLLTWADTVYAEPTIQSISTMRHGRAWVDGTLQRDMRLDLATATLHNNVIGILVGSPFDPLRGFMPDQWADEYSVTPAGQASGDDAFKGWLGKPAWTVRSKGAVLRYFEGGAVIVNPTDAAVSLAVGEGYYRISGTNSTNNGQAAGNVVVPGRDGLFLVRRR